MIVDQTEFTHALLNPDIAVPTGLIGPSGSPAGKRFDVHRNNVVVSLIDAMKTAFPVIHKLLGDSFFKAMSAIYVRTHPPKSPILMFYGEDFSAFLMGFEQVQHLPYLPDMARLELARRHSYHSADIPAVAAKLLGDLSPEDLMRAKFILSPMMRIVASDYPVLSIWQMNMMDNAPKIEAACEVVLITRPELDMEMHKLDPPTHIFLTQLKDKSLGSAYDAAISVDEDFDLTQAIALLLSQNMIIKIS